MFFVCLFSFCFFFVFFLGGGGCFFFCFFLLFFGGVSFTIPESLCSRRVCNGHPVPLQCHIQQLFRRGSDLWTREHYRKQVQCVCKGAHYCRSLGQPGRELGDDVCVAPASLSADLDVSPGSKGHCTISSYHCESPDVPMAGCTQT